MEKNLKIETLRFEKVDGWFCGLYMPRDKRSKRGENYLAENHGIAGHGRRAVLLQLVAAGLAADGDGERGFLHTDPIGRVYLPLDGRRVDVPPAEEQSHG